MIRTSSFRANKQDVAMRIYKMGNYGTQLEINQSSKTYDVRTAEYISTTGYLGLICIR